MRIHAYRDEKGEHHLAVEQNGNRPRTTPYRDLAEFSEALVKGELVLGASFDVDVARPSPITLGASKMLFAGINYRDHISEIPDQERPREPVFFSKLPTTLCASGDPIRIPDADIGCDYEVELAAVIGKTTRHVRPGDVAEAILGFTVLNDVSARVVQITEGQLTLGKNLDGFCPTASVLISPDEIDHTRLALRTVVNGEVRQDASTADMLFSVEELVARLSTLMTLWPGDVVSTGTPGGVGWFRHPRQSLAEGDMVSVEISEIGRVDNTIHVERVLRPAQ